MRTLVYRILLTQCLRADLEGQQGFFVAELKVLLFMSHSITVVAYSQMGKDISRIQVNVGCATMTGQILLKFGHGKSGIINF